MPPLFKTKRDKKRTLLGQGLFNIKSNIKALATGEEVDPTSAAAGFRKIGNFAKELVQATPRAAVSVALSLKPREKREQVIAQGKIPQAIFGERPIKTLGLRQRETTGELEKLGISKKFAKPLAGLGVAGGTLLDIIPQGKGLKKIIEKGIKGGVKKMVERGFIKSTKEVLPEIARAKVAGQYIPRDTDELAIKARNLILTNPKQAENLAKMGTDDNAVATAAELIKHYNQLGQKAGESAEAIAFYDKAAEVANTIAPKLTEQGRAIQAASILGRMTPEGQLRFAAREIQRYNEEITQKGTGLFGTRQKIPELTGEQSQSILNQMGVIKKMEDGTEKAMAFRKLQDEIADLVPSTMYQKIISLWKAGLLTGIKTSGLNISSNLFHGVSEAAKDIPAVAVDKVISLFTGKRTLGLTGLGTGRGVKEGFGKGFRYLKTGFDERNVATKLDWKRVNFGKSKVAKGLQKYEETVFRVIGAEDQPFYYGAKARSLQSQAIAQAKNNNLRGETARKFIDDLVENPTDEMLKYATNDAEIAVFQNKTVLGNIARGIQKHPGGEIVVPFGRTPAAVATQMINYTPIGIAKTIIENIGRGKFDQRMFAQGLGRGLIGSGVMAIGMELFKKDMVTLGWPKDERTRKQWELEGRKANSILINGKWRSVNILGPAGNVLIMGSYLQNGIEETGSFSEGLVQAGAGGAKSLTEQTFLQGLKSFTDAITDPERFALAFGKRTTASGIPTIVSDVAQAMDPLQRETKEKFFDPLQARIPGARQQLQPKIDILGRPLERTGNIIETMIDPTRPSRIKSSAIIEEFRRLGELDLLPTPTEFADEKKKFAALTSEQKTLIKERAGSILESKLNNLFQAQRYLILPDEEKSEIIQKFTNESRVIARAEMLQELVSDLEEEKLLVKLGELKKAGFVTQQVFDKWQELF